MAGPSTTLAVTNSAEAPIERWWIDQSGALHFMATIEAGQTVSAATTTGHTSVLHDEEGYALHLIEGGTQTSDNGSEGLDDSIEGGSGADAIITQYGNDTVDGGEGNDLFQTGIGDDYADGGCDADTFVVADGFGIDTLIRGEGGHR